MAAVKYNFEIEQGATFSKSFVWKTDGDPVDLTNCTARMQIRPAIGSAEVLLELTTQNGRIVITPEEGMLELRINSVVTAQMNWIKGVYDLEVVTPNGVVTRLVRGNVTVSKEVTR